MEFKLLKNNTPLFNVFSELGQRIYLPDGIFHWSGRAKKEAEIIGTIGTAYGYEKDFIDGGLDNWAPLYLDSFKNYTNIDITSVVPYASIGGLQELRNIWKEWIIYKAGYKNKESRKTEQLERYITLPTVTQGITNGLFMVGSLFLNEGDFIISPNKRWGNYDNIFSKNLNAEIKSFDFFRNKQFNLEGFEQAIIEVAEKQEKILIILNFPNNPTGYTPLKSERDAIIQKLKETQKSIDKPIIIFVDDAYEPYVYNDNSIDHSIFYELMELDENIIPIKLDGISKELLAYGGRIGFVTIGLKPSWIQNEEELKQLKQEINNKLEGLNRSSISNTNHFYQAVTLKMFEEIGFEMIVQKREKNRNLLKNRYELINKELKKIENTEFSIDPNSGGFFLFVNLDYDKIKATEFADHLLKKYKVGVIPIEKPEININGIRIAYCSIDINDISEMVDRIHKAFNDF
ncbi:MAG: aminotransferase class I/II-fold pyridoxal phosphate-dependent enzyme [Promethearchaeota archaeon]|nr:MAG: aminotransferase class I/II-fold pyridoxal phosphate-dependent enzyme [Candidatus Lokiarchaeota archaeon]